MRPHNPQHGKHRQAVSSQVGCTDSRFAGGFSQKQPLDRPQMAAQNQSLQGSHNHQRDKDHNPENSQLCSLNAIRDPYDSSAYAQNSQEESPTNSSESEFVENDGSS